MDLNLKIANNSVVAGAIFLNGIDGEPRLAVGMEAGQHILLSWPTNVLETTLQYTTNLAPPVVWMDNTNAPSIVAGRFSMTNFLSAPGRFFRLRQ